MTYPSTLSVSGPNHDPTEANAPHGPPKITATPFERLPIELFAEVITTILSGTSARLPIYYRQMMLLRLVSSFWWNVIDHGTPHLWSASSSEMHPQLVHLTLQRSRHTSLTIICGQGTSSPWGPAEETYQKLVGPHSHRWRYLCAEGTVRGSALGIALQPLLGRPLPRLEGLHVSVNTWVKPGEGELDEYPHMIYAPSLENVVLVNCAVPSGSLVGLSGLRSLRLGTLHPGLFNRHYRPPVISLSDLIAIFKFSPSLVSFQLMGYSAVVDSPSLAHSLTMPQLRVLRFSRVEGSFIWNVLKRLDTPSLKQLEIEPSAGPTADTDQTELLAIVGSRISIATRNRTSSSVLRVEATELRVKVRYGSSSFTFRPSITTNADPLLFRPLMEHLLKETARLDAKTPSTLEVAIHSFPMIRPALMLVHEFFGHCIQKLVFLWFNIITIEDINNVVESMTTGITTERTNDPCLFSNVTSLEFHVHRNMGRGPSQDSPGFANRVVEIARIRANGAVCAIHQVMIPFGAISPQSLEELQSLVPCVEASTGFVEM